MTRALTRAGLDPGVTRTGVGRAAGGALRAEWTKLRTVPGTIWLLLGVVVTTVAVSVAAVATVTCHSGRCAVDPGKLTFTGVELGQAVVAILAVLMVGGEYSSGMIGTTLTAMPKRTTVLAAKAAVLTGVVTVAAIVAVLGSLVAGRLILPGHGFTTAAGYPLLSLSNGAVARAAVGSVLYLALIGLLSLGTAMAVRDSAIAIGLVLSLLYLFPIIRTAFSDPDWRRHLEQIAPMSAGLQIQATMGLDGLSIGPWPGLGVLAAWSAAAILAGGLLFTVRDA
jgi:ABC-2 type transport system permease protein